MINPLDKQYLSTKNFKSNTNYLMDGDIFISLNGGHKYLDAESEKKISYIVLDETDKYKGSAKNIKCTGLNKNFYLWLDEIFEIDHASFENFFVTGTNGKTTTNYFLSKILLDNGLNHGSIGTLGTHINNDFIFQNQLTTEEPTYIRSFFRDCSKRNIKKVLFEASSIGIDQKRLAGLPIKHAAYLNISRDHLDYHKTYDAYISAKKKFFDDLSSQALAIVNKDNKHGATMLHHTKARKKTFSLRSTADYKCKIIENQFSGLHLNINGQDVYTKLIGSFNAANALLAYATASELGEDSLQILTVLSALNPVEGRFQQFKSDKGIISIVDYAHTPDALQNVLKTIDDIRTGKEKVVCVVGCGGDRDAGKRPLMAHVACQWADQVIFTSDNPRSEDPKAIIEEMKEGLEKPQLKKVLSIEDRSEAIKLGVTFCGEGDILLVAGKGHEKYQEVKGKRFPFDDVAVLKEHLKD